MTNVYFSLSFSLLRFININLWILEHSNTDCLLFHWIYKICHITIAILSLYNQRQSVELLSESLLLLQIYTTIYFRLLQIYKYSCCKFDWCCCQLQWMLLLLLMLYNLFRVGCWWKTYRLILCIIGVSISSKLLDLGGSGGVEWGDCAIELSFVSIFASTDTSGISILQLGF